MSSFNAFFTTVYHEVTKTHEDHEGLWQHSFVWLRVLRGFVMSRPGFGRYTEVKEAVAVGRRSVALVPSPQSLLVVGRQVSMREDGVGRSGR